MKLIEVCKQMIISMVYVLGNIWLRMQLLLCVIDVFMPVVQNNVEGFCGVMCLVLILLCSTLCPFYFCIHLDGEERAGYLTLIVFLKYFDCQCSVAFIPHSAVGWSAVCNSGIS